MKPLPFHHKHLSLHSNLPYPSNPHSTLLTSSVVHTSVSITIDVVTPPLRERPSHTTGTSNGETEQEHHNLSPAIHASRDQIVPLDELLRAILPEVPLADEADDEIDPDGGVDADDEVAHVPEDDGQVQITPDPLPREEFVHDVEWDGEEEA